MSDNENIFFFLISRASFYHSWRIKGRKYIDTYNVVVVVGGVPVKSSSTMKYTESKPVIQFLLPIKHQKLFNL